MGPIFASIGIQPSVAAKEKNALPIASFAMPPMQQPVTDKLQLRFGSEEGRLQQKAAAVLGALENLNPQDESLMVNGGMTVQLQLAGEPCNITLLPNNRFRLETVKTMTEESFTSEDQRTGLQKMLQKPDIQPHRTVRNIPEIKIEYDPYAKGGPEVRTTCAEAVEFSQADREQLYHDIQQRPVTIPIRRGAKCLETKVFKQNLIGFARKRAEMLETAQVRSYQRLEPFLAQLARIRPQDIKALKTFTHGSPPRNNWDAGHYAVDWMAVFELEDHREYALFFSQGQVEMRPYHPDDAYYGQHRKADTEPGHHLKLWSGYMAYRFQPDDGAEPWKNDLGHYKGDKEQTRLKAARELLNKAVQVIFSDEVRRASGIREDIDLSSFKSTN